MKKLSKKAQSITGLLTGLLLVACQGEVDNTVSSDSKAKVVSDAGAKISSKALNQEHGTKRKKPRKHH